jgi:hypothetical protein
MTYLFRFQQKWLISLDYDWSISNLLEVYKGNNKITELRTIIYHCFCPNGLSQPDCTVLASSQLTRGIHQPCCCTVHVYVVIHVCNSVGCFWVEANIWRFLLANCVYIVVRNLIINSKRGRVGIPLTGLASHILCLSRQDLIFQSHMQ